MPLQRESSQNDHRNDRQRRRYQVQEDVQSVRVKLLEFCARLRVQIFFFFVFVVVPLVAVVRRRRLLHLMRAFNGGALVLSALLLLLT